MLEENYCSNLDNDTTVIVGACAQYSINEMRATGAIQRKKIIAYQLEPLMTNHWHPAHKIIQNLQGADEVWDYDLDNIELLKTHGINAKYRPFLYTDKLKRIQNSENPDIDVLFYGTLMPRRTKIIYDSIYNYVYPQGREDTVLNASIVCLNHVWGEKLDNFIARSKIVLNLNPHDGENRQQQSRIFYSLINNKCVISEKSKRNYFGELINEFSTPEELMYLIADLLTDDKWRTYTKTNFSGYSFAVRNLFVNN